MVDRSLLYAQEQMRSFDFISFEHDVLVGFASGMADMLGKTTTVVTGLAATATAPNSLTVNLAAGDIYQAAPADATALGQIAQDTTQILQQGKSAAQTVTLSTAALSSGKSQWNLVQAQFSQVDVIRANDPNGGLLPFYNSTNPTQPLQGPNNSEGTLNTARTGVLTIQVIQGSVATTGSEVPPSPTTGWVPLYLVDLTYGQTQISQAQILTAGPSAGTGVPNNYAAAPFLAGLTNSHHGGGPGQAPKINLATETQGTMQLAQLPASSAVAGTGLPVMRLNAGNPNGYVAGNAVVNGTSDLCYDQTNKVFYICTTTGTGNVGGTGTAVWTAIGSVYGNATYMVDSSSTANAIVANTNSLGTALTAGLTVQVKVANANTGNVTFNYQGGGALPVVDASGGQIGIAGVVAAGQILQLTYTGTGSWMLESPLLYSGVTHAANYVRLPDGTIFMTGQVSVNGTSSSTVNFTPTFPNSCFGIAAAPYLTGGGTSTSSGFIGFTTPTRYGFTAYNTNNNLGSDFYIAMGN